MEQYLTEDDSLPFEHFVLRQRRSGVRFCDIHGELWDAAPESARRQDEQHEIITLSSDALASLIAEHAADLEQFSDHECKVEATRLIPRAP